MKHLIPEFENLRKRFPAGFESSLVLPCLRRIQEDRGYVADDDVEQLTAYLGCRVQIEEVLSYYNVPPQADRPLAPADVPQRQLLDARRGTLLSYVQQLSAAGRADHPRRRYTLSTAECLGSCGTAPMMMVNDTYHENLTPPKVDTLLEGLE